MRNKEVIDRLRQIYNNYPFFRRKDTGAPLLNFSDTSEENLEICSLWKSDVVPAWYADEIRHLIKELEDEEA